MASFTNLKFTNNIFRFSFYALLVWVFVSSFYYIGNFISGDVLADRSSNIIHKGSKYVIALIISIAFLMVHKSKNLAITYTSMLCLAVASYIIFQENHTSPHMMDALIVATTFIGMSYAASILDDAMVDALSKIIILSAFTVSFITFYEYLIMWPALNSYWTNTGGYRSVASLLNPNNLGLYFGAAILLSTYSANIATSIKLVVFFPASLALLMTGSRTAMLALLVAAALNTPGLRDHKNFIPKIKQFKFTIFFIVMFALLIYATGAIDLPDRLSNPQTAIIRLEKYLAYLLGIDSSYLLPDLHGVRVNIVSESAYFHFVNSLGLIIAVIASIILFGPLIAQSFNNSNGEPPRAFQAVLVYYLFAMMFENVLMSFPNNQLFFLALGACLTQRGPSKANGNLSQCK